MGQNVPTKEVHRFNRPDNSGYDEEAYEDLSSVELGANGEGRAANQVREGLRPRRPGSRPEGTGNLPHPAERAGLGDETPRSTSGASGWAGHHPLMSLAEGDKTKWQGAGCSGTR